MCIDRATVPRADAFPARRNDPTDVQVHWSTVTSQVEITIPFAHAYDPTCPHCGEEIGDFLSTRYPESDPEATGGEQRCPECDGPLYISVYRPSPLFAVSVPQEAENVTWLGGARRARRG